MSHSPETNGVNGASHHAAPPAGPTVSIATLASEIAARFPERGAIIRAMLAAAVAGEHVVVLGPPGTAKSAMTRTMAHAFGSSYFEVLMTRFTTVDEVIGPVKLSGLQQDRFTRAHAGYLPRAEIVFLDEIFKANSAILNALLSALNERIVHDDGQAITIPLVSCVAASNELPEGPELDALYDRFLVRLVTDYIADRDAFRAMLTAQSFAVASRVSIRAEMQAARAVDVTPDTIDALVSIRDAARAAGLVVSDRRWRQCLSLVRAVAHIDGRAATMPDDLECLEHVLWHKPDERPAVARLIAGTVNPAGAQAVAEVDAANDLLAKLPGPGTLDAGAYLARLGTANKDAKEIVKRIAALPTSRKVAESHAQAVAIQQRIARLAASAAGLTI